MSADSDRNLEAELRRLHDQMMTAYAIIDDMKGEMVRQRAINAELARALGCALVETPPRRKARPRPRLAVDNTAPSDGGDQ
jgi:hypothetical protein